MIFCECYNPSTILIETSEVSVQFHPLETPSYTGMYSIPAASWINQEMARLCMQASSILCYHAILRRAGTINYPMVYEHVITTLSAPQIDVALNSRCEWESRQASDVLHGLGEHTGNVATEATIDRGVWRSSQNVMACLC